MKNLMYAAAVFAVIFVIVAFALGWMTFNQTDQKATIEIDTGKIRGSAEQALDQGKELLNKADKSLSPDPTLPTVRPSDDRY